MRALVTGANGFIGSHVVDRLLAENIQVRCLVRPRASLQWLTSPGLDLYFGDLDDQAIVEEAIRDIDFIFHVAGALRARLWEEYEAANIRPVRSLLDAVSKLGTPLERFVLVSSTGAAGPSPDGRLLDESVSPNPISNYGRSKLEAENIVREQETVPFTIVRPCAVYGPRDPNFTIMFRHVLGGWVPMIGAEEQYICLLHVEDLASAILTAATSSEAEGNTYFLASERPFTRTEILNTVEQIVGSRARRVVLPKAALTLAKIAQNGMTKAFGTPPLIGAERLESLKQRFWGYSIESAHRDFGFTPRWSLHDGLSQTYLWYREHEWLT